MKRRTFVLFYIIFGAISLLHSQTPISDTNQTRSHIILGISSVSDASGIVFTGDSILLTNDSGQSWSDVGPKLRIGEAISSVDLTSPSEINALIVNSEGQQVILAVSNDGGTNWSRRELQLSGIDDSEAYLGSAKLNATGSSQMRIEFQIQTSSNFKGKLVYISPDGGNSWVVGSKTIEKRTEDGGEAQMVSGNWRLETSGSCSGFKSGCVQETRLLVSGQDATPPSIVQKTAEAKAAAAKDAVPMFAAPGGSTRISLNRGFDKCTAATVSQMQTWWNTSDHYNANIYLSGRNRGCSQPQLTAAWVDQVSAMGWGLIPTVVGYQAPCTASTTSAKLSSDPVVAEQQGRGEADIAMTDASNLGITTGSVLYYDMERYDDLSGTGACSNPVKAFLKGWTDRLKEQGYISGVYGSPKNAQEDWVLIPAASRMDAVWMARWDNVPSVWTYVSFPNFPTTEWTNHQRIKQWQAPHNETWGGVTFNIDGNILDAPVAGPAIAKNKRADFDGDGRSDVSVFRPSTNVWYVFNSSNSSYQIVTFGSAGDIGTPGDFDGDGKTDHAVFRPSTGQWHMLLKGFNYQVTTFGSNGDIPVAADYNGDGKADPAVFRPSDGLWYIAHSDSRRTVSVTHFGLSGDLPVPGDYDGDGKTDIAVWRPSTGVWYVLRSSDGSFDVHVFGMAGDKPAQGDFDGDGKTDPAVYRDGSWYVLNSTGGNTQVNFGLAGDVPTTGDFDGDGKDDVAVFRPSTGIWYILQSTSGFTAYQFGVDGDKPVPNMYLPQ